MSDNDSNGQIMRVPQAGEVARQDFAGTGMEVRAETSASALAAQAKAAIEARFIMAMRKPRDIDNVRANLLKACKRPLFAEDAIYSRPVGKEKNEETGQWEEKVAEGLSIRFAEEAARCMGNLMPEVYAIYDDARKRIIRVVTTDLESNLVYSKDITVEKTTERRQLKKGQTALGSRQNSYGDTVYIVQATDDEMTRKEGALTSKALRDQINRLVPSDIREECFRQAKQTVLNKAAEDPDAARKRLLDGFASIGVQPIALKDYVGQDLATLSPAQIVKMRELFTAIRDGQTTWATLVEEKREGDAATAADAARQAAATGAPAPTPAADPKKGKQSLTDVAAKSKAQREAQQQPAQGAPSQTGEPMPAWAGGDTPEPGSQG